VYRNLLCGAVLLSVACHTPKTATGGPPKPGPIPSTHCDGRAPVDEALKGVPGVRGSWFNDPSGHERLYVLEAGPVADQSNGPTLVLIHGVGEIGTADYYPVLAQLSRDRHVLAVDLPGFGRSNPEDQDFGPERLAHSVDTVVRQCATGPIDVLGHSSGGALALLFASLRSDVVRRLVLADVAGVLRPEVLLHGQLHQTLTPMRERVPVLSKAVEKTGSVIIDAIQALVPSAKSVSKTGLLGDSPGVLAATALLDYNFGPAIAAVRAPTLILWGQEDYVMPTRIAHLLDERIEKSELAFIPGAGHVPMKDQPELMAKLVDKYLNEPRTELPKKEKPPQPSSTRDGVCQDQEGLTLEGRYDEIVITGCKRVRLHEVEARHVIMRNSEGRFDQSHIAEGLVLDDADLIVTGGTLRGKIAIETSDSELDIAGVEIRGSEAAVRAHKESELVLSVTSVESPKTKAMLHKEVKLDDGQEL
jgi:pimeloyl-ACP methyl ester carboxylesterase